MIDLSLAIQNTYDRVEFALFEQNNCVEKISENKIYASKQTIPLLDNLLSKHSLTIHNIQWISVNQGPGPFTTLRVIIATVNGLSFTSSIPLIGIDGIKALLEEHQDRNYAIKIALLDAFNKDIYFAIQEENKPIISGYKNIDLFCQEIAQFSHKKVLLMGNGAITYKNQLQQILPDNSHILENVQTCSIEQIGKLGYKKWQEQTDLSNQLFPLYLKHQRYKTQQGDYKII